MNIPVVRTSQQIKEEEEKQQKNTNYSIDQQSICGQSVKYCLQQRLVSKGKFHFRKYCVNFKKG